jgi:hypothetical protein
MVLLNKLPPTARAMDKAVGKTRARQHATPNRAQPSAKSTTLTNHAAVTELPVLSTVKTMGATRGSQGPAKTSLEDSSQKARLTFDLNLQVGLLDRPARSCP